MQGSGPQAPDLLPHRITKNSSTGIEIHEAVFGILGTFFGSNMVVSDIGVSSLKSFFTPTPKP